MTCAHVLGLIDAGPFADYPYDHLEAVRRHARGCPTCGPALKAAGLLAADLAALPHAVPPPHLEAVVLARIARADRRPAATSAAAPEGRSAFRWMGATVAGSLAAGFGIHGMTIGQSAAPLAAVSMVAFAAGLALYLLGLFAPVRDRS